MFVSPKYPFKLDPAGCNWKCCLLRGIPPPRTRGNICKILHGEKGQVSSSADGQNRRPREKDKKWLIIHTRTDLHCHFWTTERQKNKAVTLNSKSSAHRRKKNKNVCQWGTNTGFSCESMGSQFTPGLCQTLEMPWRPKPLKVSNARTRELIFMWRPDGACNGAATRTEN